ncbi:MAG: PD40 domain-containing protein [Myxococcales bacterium]|nr:PD40 domain-containing protein [Myxococcales bacterium]
MRLIALALAASLAAAAPAGADEPAPAQAPSGGAPGQDPARDPEDILGDLVVEASRRSLPPLRLPKIAVEVIVDDDPSQRLAEIVRRDLDLSFELEVIGAPPPITAPASDVGAGGDDAEAAAADPAKTSADASASAPLDLARWREAGAELVARVRATPQGDGQAELQVLLYSLADGDAPVFKRSLTAARGQRRLTSHRLSDAIVGAITGYAGPFASQLTFIRARPGERRVWVIDADGERLLPRSPPEELAVSPAFGPDHVLTWAASVGGGRYRLRREGSEAPIDAPIVGSIYGIAFNDDRSKIALSIAHEGDVRLFVGPADASTLAPASSLPLALHPAFSPRGALAFAGTARKLQRIYVDGRATSPSGLSASAPVFCRHPEGTRLIYSVVVGKREELVAADERGRDAIRLTRGEGRNAYPACSPDGRLVAFFSTRPGGEGPGLYLMRVDGRRPAKKIANVVGDSLRWARVP